MRAPTPSAIRLEPMSEAEFHTSVQRAIARHAADSARRGFYTPEAALRASEAEFQQFLPKGRNTPDRHFAHIVRAEEPERVGETWYLVQERGGKTRLWVDWIWIDPEHRRRGYAAATLQQLEGEARRAGAEHLGLNVWFDNPGAIALYTKQGFTPASMWMLKPLAPSP